MPETTHADRRDRAEQTARTRFGLTDAEARQWRHDTEQIVFDTPGLCTDLPPLEEVIAYLDDTDPASWWAGPTFRSAPDEHGRVRHCVISHVVERWGPAAGEEFAERYSTSYVIGAAVNDTTSLRYPQPEPKDRVLAFLRALATGDELSTYESMAAEAIAHERSNR